VGVFFLNTVYSAVTRCLSLCPFVHHNLVLYQNSLMCLSFTTW